MELRHLRYFVAVAEVENISRAAARLRVAQPSVSRQIRDLESSLGLELFERSAKSVRLSAAGSAFLEEARAVLRRAEEARLTARALANGVGRELHVGYAPSLTIEVLPRTLRQFNRQHPEVSVRLHDLSTHEMVEGLRGGELDVALMIRASGIAMKGIRFESLRRFPVCVAGHPSHPLMVSGRVKLAAVVRERLIAYNRDDYPEYHAWLSALFSKAGSSPSIAEEHDGATSLIAAVESGRGIALVQKGFESLTGPRLSVVPLVPAPPPFVLGIAHRTGRLPAATEGFLSAAREGREPSDGRCGRE